MFVFVCADSLCVSVLIHSVCVSVLTVQLGQAVTDAQDRGGGHPGEAARGQSGGSHEDVCSPASGSGEGQCSSWNWGGG